MPVGTAGTVKAMYPEQVRGARRRHHPRQHLSPDAAAGRRARRAARRPARIHALAAPDPDRFRRLPGHVAGASCASSTRTASPSARISTARRIELTPERSIEIQRPARLRHPMQLDECVALPAERERDRARHGAVAALGRALQGGVRRRSRARRCSASCRAATIAGAARSARPQALAAIGFDGYAIGGLAVGEPQEVMLDDARRRPCRALPADRPRYLMGVGTPDDILESGGARHRHVRLRAADARRPPRPRLHPARQGQPAERPPRRRSAPARRGERLPGRARLFARLSAPSRQGRTRCSARCC